MSRSSSAISRSWPFVVIDEKSNGAAIRHALPHRPCHFMQVGYISKGPFPRRRVVVVLSSSSTISPSSVIVDSLPCCHCRYLSTLFRSSDLRYLISSRSSGNTGTGATIDPSARVRDAIAPRPYPCGLDPSLVQIVHAPPPPTIDRKRSPRDFFDAPPSCSSLVVSTSS